METELVEPLAVTVAGPISAPSLGRILPHESLLYDHTARASPPATLEEVELRDAPIALHQLSKLRQHHLCALANLRPDPAAVEAELHALRAALGATPCCVCDCAAAGRDPRALRELSRRTGVHIVMAASCASASALDDDELVDHIVSELLEGIAADDGSRIRAGLIELELAAADSGRLLRAAAAAHVRSGAPIFCVLGPEANAGADAAVHQLIAAGARPSAIVVCRAQLLLDAPDELRALLRRGVTLCFGGAGTGWCVAGATAATDKWAEPPTDGQLARGMAALVAEGWGEQLLLTAGVESALQLQANGGGGLGHHLLASFLPRLALDPGSVAKLTSTNAQRLLAWWRPAAAGPRQTTLWTCAVCKRTFEEALHPKEALDTDQHYYEKFDRRYCGMDCLGAHRRAGFRPDFVLS